ncbi:MAG TPA: carboxypeptidase-like regulatory domain-containing protein [Acidobacteriaceae bacterium]|nr:carboxypeptidase-like regulatory domain-containing protein [Acidobacteriaceae bacterium]
MNIVSVGRRGLAMAALLGVAVTWALGQATNTGTVVGTIVDQSGAVIPGAAVTASNSTTGTAIKTATNSDGGFIIQNVPPGTYTLTASKQGFSVARANNVLVSVGTQTTVNLNLKVGSTAETVEVQVLGTELQTLNSTVGSTIAPVAISSLPSLNHDVGTFTELQPGVAPNGAVAGAVNDQNMFLLDGGNNSNDMDGSNSIYTSTFSGDPTGVASANGMLYTGPTGVMPTPQDSVEEVKVNTTNQTADFDNSAGAQVELVTPRGTNRWHGGVYEYYLDNGFDANTWQNNQTNTPITQYHYSRFGAKAGGWVLPAFWGGRTYIFGFYEGYRYPQAVTIEHAVPSANLRAGIVGWNGTNYNMASVDPRGIGINPDVAAMWAKYEPAGNDTTCGTISGQYCDGVNEIGFKANLALPLSSNDLAFRIDHAFSAKWNWYTTYRYYKLTQKVNDQVDIGGFFSGDKLGVPAAVSSRPQDPWYITTGLTTNITPNTTNDFHYSFLRNYWLWTDNNAPTQIPGLGGAVEPGGEASINYALIPFNVNTQSIRTRFWDGDDHFLSDNVTVLKGNHLLQFGGQYQHDYDYHQRSDNGGGINFTTTYQLGDSSGGGLVNFSDLGGGYPTATTQEGRVAAEVLGIVTDSQVAYTRSGASLALNPPLTHAFDQSTIPFYNAYFSDTWHMKPSVTLTYGMGYTLEMPPTEAAGRQTVVVDAADEPLQTQDYFTQREVAAEQGESYNPELGFALVANVGSGLKYPYDPFYGSFSPRIGIAWNPSFSKATVIRGGYGRLYGRLNGVDLVLVPLLGVGLIQAVQCREALSNGNCGPTVPTAATAFRVGVDGNSAPLPAATPTAPQPIYTGYNFAAGAASEGMDPHFRPDDIDSFDLTIQRQIGQKMLFEVGYIGRLDHHEYQPYDLNAVPYMMSIGGQQFQTAYASLERGLGCATTAGACGKGVPAKTISGTANPAYTAYINSVAAQPFFEAALAGTGYCSGKVSNGSGTPYANCTAAVLDNELSHLTKQQVWNLWSDLDNGGFNFSRTMENTPITGSAFGSSGQMSSGIAENASTGYGNYNALFFTFSTHDWHGLTMQHNFTYSKALGTGAEAQATSEYTADNPYNLGTMYGVQDFDRRIVYNTYMVAQEPWFKGQQGLLGRAAGGWSFAPIFTAGSGSPINCSTVSGAQSFGEADDVDYAAIEQCVFNTPYAGGHSAHFGVTGGTDAYGNSIGTHTSKTPVNEFSNPVSIWNQVRAPILGIDTKDSGEGAFMGMPYWNLDGEVKKNVRLAESMTFEFSFIATNMLNHRQFTDASMSLNSASTWGVLTGQTNAPRQMEFGGRIDF